METKWCKDCQHIVRFPGSFPGCGHPANMKLSLVTGTPDTVQHIDYCRESVGHCKPSGEHFEAKPE